MTSTQKSPLRLYVLDLDHTLIHGILKSNYIPLFRNIPNAEQKVRDMGLVDIGSHIVRLRPGLDVALKRLKETGLLLIYSHASETYGLSVCNVIDPKHNLLEWKGGMKFTPDELAHGSSRAPKNLHALLMQYVSHHADLVTRELHVVILDDKVEMWRPQDQTHVFQLNAFIDWNLYCYETFRVFGFSPYRSTQMKHYLFCLNVVDPNGARFDACTCDNIPHTSTVLKTQDYLKMYHRYYKQYFRPVGDAYDSSGGASSRQADEEAVNNIQLFYFCKHGIMYSKFVAFDIFAWGLSQMELLPYRWNDVVEEDSKQVNSSVNFSQQGLDICTSVPLAPSMPPKDSRELDSPLLLPRPMLPFIVNPIK